jgi:hypothetical protein
MPTDDAIRQYITQASAVFAKDNRKLAHKGATFKATTLENSVKDLVAAKALGDRMISPALDGRRPDESSGRECRAFVCAMPARNLAHPQRIRTYVARANAGPDCLIWEAARATTAAPTLFKRIAIAAEPGHPPQEYVDGGVRCNNPVREIMEEARAVFGGDATLGCLVSVGAGHPGVIGLAKPDAFQKLLPLDLVRALTRVAADCESEAQSAARRFRNTPDRYFRFSVTHGAGEISLEEWQRMDELTAHTDAYLKDVVVSRSVDKLVSLLCGRQESGAYSNPVITLDGLCKYQTPQFALSILVACLCTPFVGFYVSADQAP